MRDLLVFFAAQGVILVRDFARGVLQSQNRLGVHVAWLREYTADVIVGLHDAISASRLFLSRSTFFRYLVHQIMWYFRSKTACALCLYSAILPILTESRLLKADPAPVVNQTCTLN